MVILPTVAPPITPSVWVTSPLTVRVPSPLSIIVQPFCSTFALIVFALRTPSPVCVNFSAVRVFARISPPFCVSCPLSVAFLLTTSPPVPASTVPLNVTPLAAVIVIPFASNVLPEFCSIVFAAVSSALPSAMTSSPSTILSAFWIVKSPVTSTFFDIVTFADLPSIAISLAARSPAASTPLATFNWSLPSLPASTTPPSSILKRPVELTTTPSVALTEPPSRTSTPAVSPFL